MLVQFRQKSNYGSLARLRGIVDGLGFINTAVLDAKFACGAHMDGYIYIRGTKNEFCD